MIPYKPNIWVISEGNVDDLQTHEQESGAPKGPAKEIVLKADRALFAQMIVIGEVRQVSIKEVLSHPLGPLPWSLAASDGSLRKQRSPH